MHWQRVRARRRQYYFLIVRSNGAILARLLSPTRYVIFALLLEGCSRCAAFFTRSGVIGSTSGRSGRSAGSGVDRLVDVILRLLIPCPELVLFVVALSTSSWSCTECAP